MDMLQEFIISIEIMRSLVGSTWWSALFRIRVSRTHLSMLNVAICKMEDTNMLFWRDSCRLDVEADKSVAEMVLGSSQ
jgi:hypothetical protein